MKKIPHSPTLSILVASFLILIGVYMYGVIKIEALRSKTDELNASIQTNSGIVKRATEKSRDAKVSEESQDLAKLEDFFIRSGQEFRLIQDIESICKDSLTKCSIQPVGLNPIEGLPDQFSKLHILVSAEGTFNHLYKITSILQTLPYVTDIEKVNIQADGENVGLTSGKQWREDFDITVITSK